MISCLECNVHVQQVLAILVIEVPYVFRAQVYDFVTLLEFGIHFAAQEVRMVAEGCHMILCRLALRTLDFDLA